MAETPYERSAGSTGWSAAPARLWGLIGHWQLGIILILLLGGVLRFNGLDWDQPRGANTPLQMHPDERFLSLVSDRIDWPGAAGYFDTANSPLNPYNDGETNSYVYGTFPLFLAKAVATIAGDDGAGTGDSYDATVVWGRRLTALFDTATIAVVFALGAVLFTRRVGLLGALLYALAVLPTQLAHFWTMDPYVTFFGALTLLLSALLVTAKERHAYLIALAIGVTLGLGLACKVNAAVFSVAPAVTIMLRIGLRDFPGLGLRWAGEQRRAAGNWAGDVSMLCVAAAVTIIVFRFAQPYAFAGPNVWDMAFNPRWLDDIERERLFQQGNADFPPFVQFAGRTPFLTPLRNMVLWGMGPGLGLAALVSTVVAGVMLFRRRELAFALPLAFVTTVFLFQGPRFVAFMRYFEPMYPALCLLAGWGLVALWDGAKGGGWTLPRRLIWTQPSPRAYRWGAAAVIATVLAMSAWWALAFQSVYREEHPRIAASQWIYDNVPDGARITGELWDDTIPYGLPGQSQSRFELVELEPYETDSPEKVRKLVFGAPEQNGQGGLNSADYVAVTSDRVRDSVARLEREYPATNRYYELLDSGELGFELVATFDVHPTFLGLSLDDSGAEESFTVYDHPTVRIYEKTAEWDPRRALAMLNEAYPERAVNLLPRQGRTNGLQFTPEEARVQQSGGTFSDVFDADGWASSVPWLWWIIWLELAAFAALPWVTWLFRALPDRGYGLSKLLGLAAVALPTWLLVAWGAANFSGTLVWLVFAAAVASGAGVAFFRRASLGAEARDHWRSWVAMEAVFLAAFTGFLLLRAYNPDLWHHPQGGEKPMEIAYLTAVARSTQMPPYDPWFAGGTMNYYYMGWFFLSVPIRALKLVPEVAFNLGVPTYAALAASVAFSTVHNLVGLAARVPARGGEMRAWRRPAILTGVFGAFLLIGLANLDGAHQTIERLQTVNQWGLASSVPVVGGAVGIVGGLYQWLFEGAQLPPFDWWRSSRVHFGLIDITEFPYWSMLFGDLHPHLMGLPFFGLTIALVVAYASTVASGDRGRPWLLAGLLGLALGLVRSVHTWDFPTAVLIAGAGIPLGQLMRAGRWQQRWWDGVAHLAVAALVCAVAFAPYTANFETFDPGVLRSRQTTPAHQFFVQFGVFVALAVVFLAVRYHEVLQERAGEHGRNPFLAVVNGRWEVAALLVFLTGLTAFSWSFGLTTIALAAVIELFLLNLLWLELSARDRHIPRTLATAMLALGFAVAAGVDIVTLKNDIDRMNTVFKFSLQAWQLFALGGAFAAWYAGSALWRAEGWRARPTEGRRMAAFAATASVGVLLIGSSIFLLSGTAARQERRFAETGPTLNGLAYLPFATIVEDRGTETTADDVEIRLQDDEPLIRWLRDNVQGSPVIVEAVGPLYQWTGRISENTGLPAVIGWDWHQIQQRTDYAGLVQQRRSDTQQFWTDPSVETAELYLRKYNVSYVVVGTEERVHGTPEGLAKLSGMESLAEVFAQGDYRIYRVDQTKLRPPG